MPEFDAAEFIKGLRYCNIRLFDSTINDFKILKEEFDKLLSTINDANNYHSEDGVSILIVPKYYSVKETEKGLKELLAKTLWFSEKIYKEWVLSFGNVICIDLEEQLKEAKEAEVYKQLSQTNSTLFFARNILDENLKTLEELVFMDISSIGSEFLLFDCHESRVAYQTHKYKKRILNNVSWFIIPVLIYMLEKI